MTTAKSNVGINKVHWDGYDNKTLGQRAMRLWLCENAEITQADNQTVWWSQKLHSNVRNSNSGAQVVFAWTRGTEAWDTNKISTRRLVDLITGPLTREQAIQELERVGSEILGVVQALERAEREL